MNIDIHSRIKVTLVGDASVGKSTFLQTYINGKYPVLTNATIGAEYRGTIYNYDDKLFKIDIWDTAGQETFRSLTPMYYRSSRAILLFFDLTNQKSFENLNIWLNTIQDNISTDNAFIILIGTKTDLIETRCVDASEISLFVSSNSVISKYIEISSLLCYNINYVLSSIVSEHLFLYKDKVDAQDTQLVDVTNKKYSNNCCY